MNELSQQTDQLLSALGELDKGNAIIVLVLVINAVLLAAILITLWFKRFGGVSR
jgi:hypothetical protein